MAQESKNAKAWSFNFISYFILHKKDKCRKRRSKNNEDNSDATL